MLNKQYPYLQNNYFYNSNEEWYKRSVLDDIHDFVNQRQYIKITLLNWIEEPLKEIEGIISGGSISKNGTSAVRCNMNVSCSVDAGSYNVDDMKSDFAINKKIFVEIGILNETDKYLDYPIFWFPQGIFFISSFSMNSATSSAVNISLTLKDKMAMLNGDVGGKLPATVTFDSTDTQLPTGEYVSVKTPIFMIIQELVNHYGAEDLNNIVIEDVPLTIRRVLRWNGDSPLYFYKDENALSGSPQNTTGAGEYTLTKKESEPKHTYYKGDDIGYRRTSFIVTDHLIGNAGDSVVTILDKIKHILGNYEYFYDALGVFHFREIKNYLNTTQGKTVLDEMQENDYIVESNNSKSIFTFTEKTLITSITVTPQYENIKNDYIVIGNYTNSSNLTTDVRYHLAIDKKPRPLGIDNRSQVSYLKDRKADIELIQADIAFLNHQISILNKESKDRVSDINRKERQAKSRMSFVRSAGDNVKKVIQLLCGEYAIPTGPPYQNISAVGLEVTDFYPDTDIDSISIKVPAIEEGQPDKIVFPEFTTSVYNNLTPQGYWKLLPTLSEIEYTKRVTQYNKDIKDWKKALYQLYKIIKTQGRTVNNNTTYKVIATTLCDNTTQIIVNEKYTSELTWKTANIKVQDYNDNESLRKKYKKWTRVATFKKLVFPNPGSAGTWVNDSYLYIKTNATVIQKEDTTADKILITKPSIVEKIPVVKNVWESKNTNKGLFLIEEDDSRVVNQNILKKLHSDYYSINQITPLTLGQKKQWEEMKVSQSKWEAWKEAFNLVKEHWSEVSELIENNQPLSPEAEWWQGKIDPVEQSEESSSDNEEDLFEDENIKHYLNIQWYSNPDDVDEENRETDNFKYDLQNITFLQVEKEISIAEANLDKLDVLFKYTKTEKKLTDEAVYYNDIRISLETNYANYLADLALYDDLLTTIDNLNNAEDKITWEDIKVWLFGDTENDGCISSKDILYIKTEDDNKITTTIQKSIQDSFQGDTMDRIKFLQDIVTLLNSIISILEEEGLQPTLKSNPHISQPYYWANLIFGKKKKSEDNKEISEILVSYLDTDTNLIKLKFITNAQAILTDETGWEIQYPNEPLKEPGILDNFYFDSNKNCVYWNGTGYVKVDIINIYYGDPTASTAYLAYDWRTALYLQGLYGIYNESTDKGDYYEELAAYWPRVYDLENQQWYIENKDMDKPDFILLTEGCYYLDFLDSLETSFGEWSVSNIGRRTDVVSNDKINCLFEPEIPNYNILNGEHSGDSRYNILGQEWTLENEKKESRKNAEPFIQVPTEIWNNISTGGYKNSAFEQIKYELYLHTRYQKSISLTSIPVFYLEPNSRITLSDSTTQTFGDFIVTNVRITLGPGATMSVAATETLERF